LSQRARAKRSATRSQERLRRLYKPARVRILFVGEAPPASGRFFYQGDSGLYRATRDAFLKAFPELRGQKFLQAFRARECYLVDLCANPVDRLSPKARREACRESEARLGRTLRKLQPWVLITVVRSITNNVKRAEREAGWSGLHKELPYPGRWQHLRREFVRSLVPLLRQMDLSEKTTD
jgi:hypothetical protein